MRAEDVAARYTQPGKVAVRRFVVDLAVASGCETALDFWGGGTSARDLTRAGLSVVSAEMDRSLWSELDRDAATNGYAAHHGRASKVGGVFDMVWADFCGMVSGEMEREVTKLVPRVGRFLVVTVMPEREADPFLVGLRYTSIPALFVGWTDLRLDYVTRYKRNISNQEMWLLVLSPVPPAGRGQSEPRAIYPRALRRNLADERRRYWAGKTFTREFSDLLPFAQVMGSQTIVMTGLRCLQCGRQFLGQKSTRLYCSEPCLQRHYRKIPNPLTTCVVCKQDMKPGRADKKYCSRLCGSKSQAKVRRDNRPEIRCTFCRAAFKPKKYVPWAAYCQSKCRFAEYRRRTRESQPKPALPIAA